MPVRSIQRSLSVWFAIQAFVCLVVTSAVIYLVAHHSFEAKQRAELQRHVHMVAHLFEPGQPPGDTAIEEGLKELLRTHDELGVTLTRKGATLFSFSPEPAGATWRTQDYPTALPDRNVAMTLRINIAADEVVLDRLAGALLVVSLVASVVVSATGASLLKRGLSPLKRLAADTSSISPRSTGWRLSPEGYGLELAPFVTQFNSMMQRLEQAYLQLESFNADVAHELRTPLANLVSQIEVELARTRSPDELREALVSNLEDAQKLSSIVSDMLFLSRADRGVTARSEHMVSVAEHVRDIADLYDASLEASSLRITVVGDASAAADPGLLRRGVSNLLSNALRYATHGTTIEISISIKGESVWLVVSNRGEPVPDDALEDIFKRFYRADKSRTGSENHGLGLAIVAAIARMHSGSTRAESAGGTTRIGFSVLASG